MTYVRHELERKEQLQNDEILIFCDEHFACLIIIIIIILIFTFIYL